MDSWWPEERDLFRIHFRWSIHMNRSLVCFTINRMIKAHLECMWIERIHLTELKCLLIRRHRKLIAMQHLITNFLASYLSRVAERSKYFLERNAWRLSSNGSGSRASFREGQSEGGKTFTYDPENLLVSINGGTATFVYDGDGNRVAKSVNGVETRYLLDDLNPTGVPQVVDELTNGAVSRTYTYGLQRISQNQVIANTWTPSFFGYDGFATVRQLTNSAGTITDAYDFDGIRKQDLLERNDSEQLSLSRRTI